MSFFIVESMNYFGKKLVQVVKCIIAVWIEFLENQYETFQIQQLKTLQIFNYSQFPSFDWLLNWT